MVVLKNQEREAKSTALLHVQTAITDFSVTAITYRTPDGAITSRQVEPLAIYKN